MTEEEWFDWIVEQDLLDDLIERDERRQEELEAREDEGLEDEDGDDWYADYELLGDDEDLEEDEVLGRRVKQVERLSGDRWTNDQRFLCELLLSVGMKDGEAVFAIRKVGPGHPRFINFMRFVYNDNRLRPLDEVREQLRKILS